MRLLVIGGSGFIGSFLVRRLLDAGHEVAVVRRPESTAIIPPDAVPITATRQTLAEAAPRLRSFAPDVVIDLILSSGDQARQVVSVFRGYAKRVVAASSMDVYRATGVLHGLEPDQSLQALPLTEDSELRTRLQTYPAAQVSRLQAVFPWLDDQYDKIPVEQSLMGNPELPATILRLPMIYGPGDRLRRFSAVLGRMTSNNPIIEMQMSWAKWRSPRGYVENVATAIALGATHEGAASRIFNVAELECYSELDWAGLIAKQVGWDGRFAVLPDAETPAPLRVPGNLAQDWIVDSSRIRKELGFAEPVPRDEGIRRTIQWERDADAYRPFI